MKGLLGKIRVSRKLVLILAVVLLLLGGSGGAALFFFADRVPGFHTAEAKPDGEVCKDLRNEIVNKKGSHWVRQYVSIEGGDGMARLRTALRVALAIQERDKPDLVQVAVLDGRGPKTRADMRGRALGANVLLIAHPEKLPKDLPSVNLAARYSDGVAGPDGLFYGMKIELTQEDVKKIVATISSRDLCGDPAATKDGGEAAPETAGHDAPAAGGHEAPAAGAHDAAPAAAGHGDEHSDAGGAKPTHVAENAGH